MWAAYDTTGQKTMILQEFIDWDDYVRCICIGREHILPIRYDPNRSFFERYRIDEPVEGELLERAIEDCRTLTQALGYDMDTVELAVRDGVLYAIDFLNPAPDFDNFSIKGGQLRLGPAEDDRPGHRLRVGGGRTSVEGRAPLVAVPQGVSRPPDPVAAYHALLEDGAVAQDSVDQLREGQRERKLVFGEHPLLSTSSPFWLGRATGLKSYRGVIWSRFPRTGIPPEFPSHDEFENYVELLVKTNSIDDGKKIWWDLRPHHIYPTLEFRICDATTTVEETICIAALIQAICAKLLKLREQNLGFRKYLPGLIAENKWRAMRHGLDGKLIDFGKQLEVPARDLAEELCDFVDDVVDELGSRQAMEHVFVILKSGTSADRQLAVYGETGSLPSVVDHVASETVAGATEP